MIKETEVGLLDSVNNNFVKRPLAENKQWRHIRFTIKHRYLENYASQLRIYYGTLSESNGRSFRNRYEKLREAPSGGEITMTSYPVWNKTSLSRKSCIVDEKILLNTFTKSWSLRNNKQQIQIVLSWLSSIVC